MHAEAATCPDCKSRLGVTLFGPFDVRFTLQVPIHKCRKPNFREAIFGKAEDFLDAIVKATEKNQDLYTIMMLAKQARYALGARRNG